MDELAALLKVSVATVRRDLALLAEKGELDRTRGGAIAPAVSTAFERLHAEKLTINQAEKRQIGIAAARFVHDGETVILDSGSTTLEVARNLTKLKNLVIITNDLFIASNIVFDPTTTVVLSGGTRREGYSVLIGPVAEDFFRRVRVNKSFLSADAVDLEYGITNATFTEAALKQLIIEAAQEVVLVVDHTKFGQTALARVCPLSSIQHIVTDAGVSEPVRHDLERLGISLTIA